MPTVSRTVCPTLIVVLLVSCSSVSAVAQVLCASRLPRLPQAISNNAVTSLDHGDGTWSVYSFMGIRDGTASSVTPASFRLDLPSGQWRQIADAPLLNGRAKIGANAIAVGGSVYLIGGYTTGATEVTEERLFRYDPANDRYDELAVVPTEVDDTVAAVFQDRYIYLVSGWHGPFNNNVRNVQIYDTLTDQWQSATPIVGPGRFGHAGTILGNRIVVFDGASGSGGFAISNLVRRGEIDPEKTGNIANIAWEQLPAHPGDPTYRAAASQGAVTENQLLVLGGTNNPYNFSGVGYNNQPSLPLDQALAFDGVTGEWQALTIVGDLLPTMDHRGLVAVPDGWATVGGMLGPNNVTDEVVQYRWGDSALSCAVPEPAGQWLLWLSVWFASGRRKVRCRPRRCRWVG